MNRGRIATSDVRMHRRLIMRCVRTISGTALLSASAVVWANSVRVADEASAIAVAKKYVKAQCTTEAPCHFTPRREGSHWNVLVEFTKRNAAGKLDRYPGGHVLLYFNQEGQLVRRVKGE
jgi:hypothetical protein